MQAETSLRQPLFNLFSPLLTCFFFFFLSLPLQRYCQPAPRQRGWNEDLWGLRQLLGLDPGVSMGSGWFYRLSFFFLALISSLLPVTEMITEEPSVKDLRSPDWSSADLVNLFPAVGLSQILWCLCCCSALVITMVVSLLFILLLRYTADVLFWLLIFGVITAIGYGESPSYLPP